jgi:glycerophosphoryl diester phosphodiesterase
MKTLIVYHRGGGKSLGYPPNCIFTIAWALSQKARGIEFDVAVTKYKKTYKMIIIEPKLLLKNNLDINNLFWNDILKLDTGNNKFGSCKVATLKDVLSIVNLSQTKLQIHIKGKNSKTVSTLISELKYIPNIMPNILLTSFDLNILIEIKKTEPKFKVGWIVKPDAKNGNEDSVDLTKEVTSGRYSLPKYTNKELIAIKNKTKKYKIDVIIFCAPKIGKKEVVDKFKEKGLEIGAWGIGSNLLLARKLIKFGIDRFTLDNPEEFEI